MAESNHLKRRRIDTTAHTSSRNDRPKEGFFSNLWSSLKRIISQKEEDISELNDRGDQEIVSYAVSGTKRLKLNNKSPQNSSPLKHAETQTFYGVDSASSSTSSQKTFINPKESTPIVNNASNRLSSQQIAVGKRVGSSLNQFRLEKISDQPKTYHRQSSFYDGPTTFGGASAVKRRMPASVTPQQPVRKFRHQETEAMSSTSKRILSILDKMDSPVNDAKKIPNSVPQVDLSTYLYPPKRRRNSQFTPPISKGPPIADLSTISKLTHLNCAKRKSIFPSPTLEKPAILSVKPREPIKDFSSDFVIPASISTVVGPLQSPVVQKTTTNKGKEAEKFNSTLFSIGRDSNSGFSAPTSMNAVEPLLSSNMLKSSSNKEKEAEKKSPLFTFSSPKYPNYDFLYSTPASVSTSEPLLSPSVQKNKKKETEKVFTFALPRDPSYDFSNNFCAPPLVNEPSENCEEVSATLPKSTTENLLLSKSTNNNTIPPPHSKNKTNDTRSLEVKETQQTQLVKDNLKTVPPLSKETKDRKLLKEVENPVAEEDKVQTGLTTTSTSAMWGCDICWVRNPDSSSRCLACETVKPHTVVSKGSNPLSPTWECSSCWVKNSMSSKVCIACEAPKQEKVIPDKCLTTSSATWECSTCWVKNKEDSEKCIACEMPKLQKAISNVAKCSFTFQVPEKPQPVIQNDIEVVTSTAAGIEAPTSVQPTAKDVSIPTSTVTDASSELKKTLVSLCENSFRKPETSSSSTPFTFGGSGGFVFKAQEKSTASLVSVSSTPSTGFNFGTPKTASSDKTTAQAPFVFDSGVSSQLSSGGKFSFGAAETGNLNPIKAPTSEKETSEKDTSFITSFTFGVVDKLPVSQNEVTAATLTSTTSTTGVSSQLSSGGKFSFGAAEAGNLNPIRAPTSEKEAPEKDTSFINAFKFGAYEKLPVSQNQTAASTSAPTTTTASFTFGAVDKLPVSQNEVTAPTLTSATSTTVPFKFGGLEKPVTMSQNQVEAPVSTSSTAAPFKFGMSEKPLTVSQNQVEVPVSTSTTAGFSFRAPVSKPQPAVQVTTTSSMTGVLFNEQKKPQLVAQNGFGSLKSENLPSSNFSFGTNSVGGFVFKVPEKTTTLMGVSNTAPTGGFVFGAQKSDALSNTPTSTPFVFGSATPCSSAFSIPTSQPFQFGGQPASTSLTSFGKPLSFNKNEASQNSLSIIPPSFGDSSTSNFKFGSKTDTPSQIPNSTSQTSLAFGSTQNAIPAFGSTAMTSFSTPTFPAFGESKLPAQSGFFGGESSTPVFQFGASNENKPDVNLFKFGTPTVLPETNFAKNSFILTTPPSFNFGATSTPTAGSTPFQFAASASDGTVTQSSAPRKIKKALRRVQRN